MSETSLLASLRQRLIWALSWSSERLAPFVHRWRLLPRNRKFVAAGVVLVTLLAISLLSYRSIRGCSSRDAVMDRVALVTATLQDDAAHHRITIGELADALKRINEAAANYNTSNDPQAYCATLNAVVEEAE